MNNFSAKKAWQLSFFIHSFLLFLSLLSTEKKSKPVALRVHFHQRKPQPILSSVVPKKNSLPTPPSKNPPAAPPSKKAPLTPKKKSAAPKKNPAETKKLPPTKSQKETPPPLKETKESSKKEEPPLTSSDLSYEENLILLLQQSILLVEPDPVYVTITVQPNGQIAKIDSVSSDSFRNSALVKSALANLSLPPFEGVNERELRLLFQQESLK